MSDRLPEPMRILYLSLSYVPSRRASSIHVMKMCAAMAGLGHDVTLVTKRCPERQEEGIEDDFSFYGVPASFAVRKLPRPAARGGGLLYAWAMARLLRSLRDRRGVLVLSRDLWGGWIAARRGLPVVLEAHAPPSGALAQRLQRSLLDHRAFRRLVVISAALEERLGELSLLPAGNRVVVAPDAADAMELPAPGAVATAGPVRPQVGYVGHLYPGRGIELIADLASRLEACDFHVVGGLEDDVARWRRQALPPNLTFHGFVPPAELHRYYERFGLLLMPYQRRVAVAGGRSDTARWMSPLKMFEYMAAGRAIVASDLPALREVLTDGRDALLVPPGDLDAWEAALRRLLTDPSLRRRLGAAARRKLRREYTWEARARKVLAGL